MKASDRFVTKSSLAHLQTLVASTSVVPTVCKPGKSRRLCVGFSNSSSLRTTATNKAFARAI